MNENERNDLQTTITHALQEIKAGAGDSFDISIKLERGFIKKRKRLAAY